MSDHPSGDKKTLLNVYGVCVSVRVIRVFGMRCRPRPPGSVQMRRWGYFSGLFAFGAQTRTHTYSIHMFYCRLETHKTCILYCMWYANVAPHARSALLPTAKRVAAVVVSVVVVDFVKQRIKSISKLLYSTCIC